LTIHHLGISRVFFLDQHQAAEKVRRYLFELGTACTHVALQVVKQLLRLIHAPGIGPLVVRNREHVLVAENLGQWLFLGRQRVRHDCPFPCLWMLCLPVNQRWGIRLRRYSPSQPTVRSNTSILQERSPSGGSCPCSRSRSASQWASPPVTSTTLRCTACTCTSGSGDGASRLGAACAARCRGSLPP